jgi:hypothetical protein
LPAPNGNGDIVNEDAEIETNPLRCGPLVGMNIQDSPHVPGGPEDETTELFQRPKETKASVM